MGLFSMSATDLDVVFRYSVMYVFCCDSSVGGGWRRSISDFLWLSAPPKFMLSWCGRSSGWVTILNGGGHGSLVKDWWLDLTCNNIRDTEEAV